MDRASLRLFPRGSIPHKTFCLPLVRSQGAHYLSALLQITSLDMGEGIVNLAIPSFKAAKLWSKLISELSEIEKEYQAKINIKKDVSFKTEQIAFEINNMWSKYIVQHAIILHLICGR